MAVTQLRQTAHGQATKTMAHPAKRRDDLNKGSGLLRWIDRCRAHSAQGSDAATEAAQILYHLILRSSKMPLGIDKQIAARRIRRAILHAAKVEMEAARAWSAAGHLVRGEFGDPGSKLSEKKGFDPSK